jgi:hypothetical protein
MWPEFWPVTWVRPGQDPCDGSGTAPGNVRSLGVQAAERASLQPPPSLAAGRGRHRALLVAVAATGLAVLCATVLWIAIGRPERRGDLNGVALGADRAVECLREARFTACDRLPDGSMSGATPQGFVMGRVGPWAPLHYFMAIPMRGVGLSQHATVSLLIAVNAVAFIAIVALSWTVVARLVGREWGPVVAVCVVTSPLLWYTTVAFGEVLAALLVLVAVAAVLTRRSPFAVAVAVMLAGFTKETSPPFVAALCCLCAVVTLSDRPQRRRAFVAIGLGASAALAGNTLFNLFRFGSVFNSHYSDSVYQVSSARRVAGSFAALWIAPNTGIVWFWPAAVLVLVFLAVVGVRRIRPRVAPVARWSGAALLGLLVAQMVGLARWYSPFGWIAWGSRLVLPVLPAMLLSAVAALGSAGAAALRRVLVSGWVWGAGIVVVLAGIPQTAVLWRLRTVASFFTSGGVCGDVSVEVNADGYYRCMFERAWHMPPLLAQVVGDLRSPLGLAVTVLVAVTVAALLALARELSLR